MTKKKEKKRLTCVSFVVLRILSLSLVSLGRTSENRGRSVGASQYVFRVLYSRRLSVGFVN